MEQAAIDRLRQPHPAQKEIDARAASLLRSSRRHSQPPLMGSRPAASMSAAGLKASLAARSQPSLR